MAEVRWIKITTTMFDDEKIRVIEAMPEADSVLIVWIKLLCLAGKVNSNGFIFLTEQIPYTDETLANIFGRPLNTVKMAMELFRRFGMIEYDENGFFYLTNWDKHQNVARLQEIRQKTRERVQKFRDKQRGNALQGVTPALQERNSNATEVEVDIDKETTKEESVVFDETSQPYLMAVEFLTDLLKQHPSIKAPKENPKELLRWSKSYDKMLRIDHRPPETIRAVLAFARADSFWDANVLSPDKLREKFDRLQIEMEKRKERKPNGRNQFIAQHPGRSEGYSDLAERDDRADGLSSLRKGD